MTPGHVYVYNTLVKKFPDADVFLASTNTTTERPFTFKQKQFLAVQAGIPADKFVLVKSPYKADEITHKYDPETTSLIFALSSKDAERIKPVRKDGSLGYLQPLPKDTSNLEPMNVHGYYDVIPSIKYTIAGVEGSSASAIRERYINGTEDERKEIISDMYPNSKKKNTIKKLLDSVLLKKKIDEHIVKLSNGKYRLLSKKGKNLGTFTSHKAAAKHEGEVEYFKSLKEDPDFGYTTFNNKENELNNLSWKIINNESGIEIIVFINDPNLPESYSWNQNLQGSVRALAKTKNIIQITSIKIAKKWFGTGLGQLMYDRLIQEAKNSGYKFLRSDFDRSDNAEHAWKRLSSRYNVTKILYPKFSPYYGKIKFYQINLQKVPVKIIEVTIDNRDKLEDTLNNKINSNDISDAKYVLDNWMFEYRVKTNLTAKDIFNKFPLKLESIPLNKLKPWKDWGRRPNNNNPIIVGRLIDNNLIILDGQHRVIKAKEAGENDIKGYVIDLPFKWSNPSKKYIEKINESISPFKLKLIKLKPFILKKIQSTYNSWPGDFGLCDTVASEIAEIINSSINEASAIIVDHNSYHFWVRVNNGIEYYDIDIPFGKYEKYDYNLNKFIKIPNVKFNINDILIYKTKENFLLTPWKLRKGYIPNKNDRYYTAEAVSDNISAILKSFLIGFQIDFQKRSISHRLESLSEIAEDVNGGDCYNFAALAYIYLKNYNPKLFSTNFYGGHAFIKINSKYYDSEHINGVSSINLLDSDYKNWSEDRFDILKFSDFCKYWKVNKNYILRLQKYINSPKQYLKENKLPCIKCNEVGLIRIEKPAINKFGKTYIKTFTKSCPNCLGKGYINSTVDYKKMSANDLDENINK